MLTIRTSEHSLVADDNALENRGWLAVPLSSDHRAGTDALGKDLFDRISTLPQEGRCACQAEQGQRQVQLDNGPYPETPDWRRLLHNGYVPVCIADVDEVAARTYAGQEEYALSKDLLVAGREAREDPRVRGMGVQSVEQEPEH